MRRHLRTAPQRRLAPSLPPHRLPKRNTSATLRDCPTRRASSGALKRARPAMFDPHSPYHRRMWHYDSDRPLSVAQLVALGSLDARTAALLWLLIERHHSLIVSGPTDPMPGV